jgi:hypothetical protein
MALEYGMASDRFLGWNDVCSVAAAGRECARHDGSFMIVIVAPAAITSLVALALLHWFECREAI